MLAPVIVFFGVAGIIVGVFLGASWLSASLEGRKLARRLREVGQSPDAPDAALVMDQSVGPLPRLDGMVKRTAAGSRLARLIEQSGAAAFRRSTRPPVCCQWHQNSTVGPAPEIVAPTAPSSSAWSTSSIERG